MVWNVSGVRAPSLHTVFRNRCCIDMREGAIYILHASLSALLDTGGCAYKSLSQRPRHAAGKKRAKMGFRLPHQVDDD